MGAPTMDPAVTTDTITVTQAILTVTTQTIRMVAVQDTAMAPVTAPVTITVIRTNIRQQPSLAIRS
jgi:hypothetical protein